MTKRIRIPAKGSLRRFPPGLTLVEDCLKPMKISQKDFALRIGIDPSYLSSVLSGKIGVSADMAIRFEAALGISAEFWLRKQAGWDLQCAREFPKVDVAKIERYDIPVAA